MHLLPRLTTLAIIMATTLVYLTACQREITTPPESPESPPPSKITRKVIPPPPPPPPATWEDYDKASRLYVAGRHKEADSLLKRILSLELTDRQRKSANFLAGVNAYKADHPSDVEKYLGSAEGIPSSLTGYALYFRAQAQFSAGNYENSRVLLEKYINQHPSDTLTDQAKLTRAENLFHLGLYKEALAESMALIKADEARALLSLAKIYEGLGESKLAEEKFREAMQKSNVREVRAVAAKKYKSYLAEASLKPGQEDKKLALVRLLRQQWRLDEAMDLTDKLAAAGGNTDYIADLEKEKASAMFFSGNVEQALAYYKPRRKSSDYAAWMYARGLKRLGQWEAAATAFLTVAGMSGKYANRGRYEAALLYLKMGKIEDAEKTWASMSSATRNGKYKDNILWHKGFYYYHEGSWGKAADQFRTLIKERPKSKYVTPSTYWMARSLERAGKKKEAAPYYQKLAQRRDFYYRMLAEQRLGMVKVQDGWSDMAAFRGLLSPAQGGGRVAWAQASPGTPLGDLWGERANVEKISINPLGSSDYRQTLQQLKDLAGAGAMDLAQLEVNVLNRLIQNGIPSVKPSSKMTSDERSRLKTDTQNLEHRLFALTSAYMAEVGDYDGFVRLQYKNVRRLLAGLTEEEKQAVRRRFHPLAYPETVHQAAVEHNLHPALILAVMRTESYYQPDILSVANAQGLMQLLPSTAHKISKRLGEQSPSNAALFTPEVNIRYGAWYLASLIKEFDGQFPLAIASYNAGPFNVKRWVQQAPASITLEEFIESIPFDQTRIYVKKILGTFYEYRLLFAGKVSTPNLDVPLRTNIGDQINF